MNTIQDIAVHAVFADGFATDFRIGSGRTRGKLTAAQIRTAAERMACSRWQVENAPRSTRNAFDVFRYPAPLVVTLDISGLPKPKAVKRAPRAVCCPQCQHNFALAA